MHDLVENGEVVAIAHGETLQIAKAAVDRILEAEGGSVVVARDPDFAHREGGDSAHLLGSFDDQRLRAMIMGRDGSG